MSAGAPPKAPLTERRKGKGEERDGNAKNGRGGESGNSLPKGTPDRINYY